MGWFDGGVECGECVSKVWNVAKDMWILGLGKSFLRWRTLALICLFTVATVLALHSSVPAQVESSTQSETTTTEDNKPADSRDIKKDQEAIRPLDESTKPRIEFIGPGADEIARDRRMLLRGRIDGPDAFEVQVNGQSAEITGKVFSKEIDLVEGMNKILVKATSLDGTSTKKMLEITREQEPVIELPPQVDSAKIETHPFSMQNSKSTGVTITVNSTEDG